MIGGGGSPAAAELMVRFMAKVDRPDEGDGCWLWAGELDPYGYGRIRPSAADRKYRRAHRVGYELFVGPIPEGLQIDHLCRVRRCVNPAHLEVVTQEENLRRGESFSAVNARKTHCPKGHEYTEENTRYCHGSRYCRECGRQADRERYYAKLNRAQRRAEQYGVGNAAQLDHGPRQGG